MRRLTPRSACTCCSDPISYVFQRSSAAIMHDSGGAKLAVLGILMTSAVAMFFSWSGATDLSDDWIRYFLVSGSVFRDSVFRDRFPAFLFGRASLAKVMTLRLLS